VAGVFGTEKKTHAVNTIRLLSGRSNMKWGGPLKCLGFGSRRSSSAWNLKNPPSALAIRGITFLEGGQVMNFVALRMLTGDRAKYLGLIFAIAFCTFLLENQTSIFAIAP